MFDEDLLSSFFWFLAILILNINVMIVKDRVIDLEKKVEELISYCEVIEYEN